jgi:glutamate-ammonia-ligase adenylyltransferase
MVLAHTGRFPDLTAYTDNVRQLESLASYGLISADEANKLKTAYCTYRDLGHKQVLQGGATLIGEAEVDGLRADVECIWQKLMVDD